MAYRIDEHELGVGREVIILDEITVGAFKIVIEFDGVMGRILVLVCEPGFAAGADVDGHERDG